MALNFNLLQAIPQSQVVGSLPTFQTPQGNPTAQGALSGALQGSQLANDFQNRARTQQLMEQDKELHPYKVQQQQGLAQEAGAKGEMAQMTLSDIKERRQLFEQDKAAALQQWEKTDPEGYSRYQLQNAQYSQALAGTAKLNAETDSQVMKNQQDYLITGAQIANQVDNAPPEQQKAVADNMLGMIKLRSPELAELYSKVVYDPSGRMAMTLSGNDAMIAREEEAMQKNLPERAKNTEYYEKKLNQLNQRRDKIVENGGDTAKLDSEITRLEEGYESLRVNKQTQGGLPSVYAEKLAGAEAANVPEMQKSYEGASQAQQGDIDAIKALSEVPEQLLGPVQDFFGVATKTKSGQVLKSKLDKIGLLEKELANMGSQGFTDKDREIVFGIKGGLNKYKGALEELLIQSTFINERLKGDKWLKLDEVMSSGDQKRYEKWKDNNPEPKVHVKLPDGRIGKIPISQRNRYLDGGAKLVDYEDVKDNYKEVLGIK